MDTHEARQVACARADVGQIGLGDGPGAGLPDYVSGEQKNLKFKAICKSVQSLISSRKLKAANIHIWIGAGIGL